MSGVDVLLVSLGSTAGLRAADDALAGALRRAGAQVAVARVARTREVRTFALTDLAWALPARAAARAAIHDAAPRAIVYSSSTAALLWPEPGAIRFDAPAAGNRPGRHGIWQRPLERRRFAEATLLLPWSEGALAEAPSPRARRRSARYSPGAIMPAKRMPSSSSPARPATTSVSPGRRAARQAASTRSVPFLCGFAP